jgi:hypothetical protein
MLSSIVALTVKESGLLFAIVAFALAAIAVWDERRAIDRARQARIDEIAKTRPEFRKFYETWTRERSADALEKVLVVAGVIVAGAVGAAASEIERSHKEAQIQEAVDRAVDDELRRRGY